MPLIVWDVANDNCMNFSNMQVCVWIKSSEAAVMGGMIELLFFHNSCDWI